MAYAALLSLMHVLDQLQLLPPLLHENQIKSFQENIAVLQDLLEKYSLGRTKEAEDLESRIRDTAYEAEDIIESHVADYLSESKGDQSATLFHQNLEKVIAEMYHIKEEVSKIKENNNMKDQQLRHPTIAGSSRLPPSNNDVIVGLDDGLTRIMDELTGHGSSRKFIPIVGMGGSGKTTLAKKVYANLLIVQRFDVRAWVTVSQDYSAREILLGLLREINPKGPNLREDDDGRLGELLHKSLYGRRYLVVLDDTWSIGAWDEISRFLPDNSNGSRIMVTTRLLNLVHELGSRDPYRMNFLTENESWELFCSKVFPQESCPIELVEIGKKIVRICKGLPLAIVVIGGLFAKSKKTIEYWKYIEEDLSSILNSADEEYCLKILSLSYNNLPVHLKSCFLYMGIFPEDCEINVSKLIKLWVAGGILKPNGSKLLEEVAQENLQDLIDRNLILVSKRSRRGKIKTCSIHDLLRDLCIREAQNIKFFNVTRISALNTSQGIESERRLIVHRSTVRNNIKQFITALQSASLARSFACNIRGISTNITRRSRLLRILDTTDEHNMNDFLHLVNLQYLACKLDDMLPSSIGRFHNLQTLIVSIPRFKRKVLPSEIWQMQKLRHLQVSVSHLPEPPTDSCVLENLQTLSLILNLRLTEDVLNAIPDVKKLKFACESDTRLGVKWLYYGLNNLVHLHKLESVTCTANTKMLPGSLAFPCSLRKLNLLGCQLPWEEITIISSLPNLEVLKLRGNAFCGRVWELTEEEEFRQLKYLSIHAGDLEEWIADANHFPRLEFLELSGCKELKEIPSGIGDIPTLVVINLYRCSRSAYTSAKEILKEQRSFGNNTLQVRKR